MNWKFWNWPGQIRDLERLAQIEQNTGKIKTAALEQQQNCLKKELREQENITCKYLGEIGRMKAASRRLILRGLSEAELAERFAACPGNPLFAAVLEECDRELMETVSHLVNNSERLSDAQLRSAAGQLSGIGRVRAALEGREAAARERQKG